ncbi:type II TA system antitoxin MqsA family protein [Herbaspirillum seropedicae]|uniref:type II TA system antitoxin MqsA family protein n=1 Tax=Herbaspirillum seropedicae TaxID=964 RepID=UPI003FCDA73E
MHVLPSTREADEVPVQEATCAMEHPMSLTPFDICPNCSGEGTVHLVSTREIRTVNKEAFAVPVDFFACQRCGEHFQTTEMEDSLVKARDMYRSKHGMVKPDQLIAWRRSLGLSQVELAAILGWGVATISRYENGKLQSDAHDKAMRMAMSSADTTMELVRSANDLDDHLRKRLIDELERKAASAALEKAFTSSARTAPAESIRLDRLAQLVLLLSDADGIFVSKLNKLLFYSDFKFYQQYGRSLSGLAYERPPYGPVPSAFRLLYALLEQRGLIRQVEVSVGHAEGTQVLPLQPADRNLFDEDELGIILAIKKRFATMSAHDISAASHREQAWIQTPMAALIDYTHAATLRF